MVHSHPAMNGVEMPLHCLEIAHGRRGQVCKTMLSDKVDLHPLASSQKAECTLLWRMLS